jgi:hypothetical protein
MFQVDVNHSSREEGNQTVGFVSYFSAICAMLFLVSLMHKFFCILLRCTTMVLLSTWSFKYTQTQNLSFNDHEEKICCVCLETMRTNAYVKYVPCGHVSTCFACTLKIDQNCNALVSFKCPMCRVIVNVVLYHGESNYMN